MPKWKPIKVAVGQLKTQVKSSQVHVTNLVKSSESTVPMVNTDPPTDPDERWQFVLNHFDSLQNEISGSQDKIFFIPSYKPFLTKVNA